MPMRSWARRLSILFVCAVIALWLAAGAFVCDNSLRVHRPLRPAASLGEEVQVTAGDGVILRASFVAAPNARHCVMLLHGISDSRAGALGFAPMFVDAGYSVLAADSRAHGASGGELTTFGLLERADVLGWASWLRERGCGRLFGLGESLGGSILIQAAAQEPAFAAIVAESAFSDLRSIAEYRIVQSLNGPQPFTRVGAKAVLLSGVLYARLRYGLDLKQASPLIAARRLTTPLLLIHGSDDVHTPPDHSRAIAAAAPGSVLWIVPGALHTSASSKEPAEFRRRVLEWFASH